MVSAPALVQRVQSWYRTRLDPGLLALLVVFLALLPISTPRIYATDEVQYYVYLRSLYFDHDLDFRNEYEHFAALGQQNDDPAIYNALLREHPDDPPTNPQTGLLRNVAPVGSALLWSPGFVLTDIAVRLANLAGAQIPADGFSRPYIWAACFMSALYALLGLVLTYRLVRRFVGVFAAATATLTVWLASPLVFYTYIAMPWSHTTSFFLFALFLTIWLHNWQGPLAERAARRSWRVWALLGLVGGLMTITREQLGLLLIIPALEGLVAYVRLLTGRAGAEPDAAEASMHPVAQLFGGHIIFLVCLFIGLLPQLLTYQVLNGVPRPAGVVAGKLDPTSPNFFNTLLDPNHGAFLWSPVLVLGLLGLVWLARRDWLLALLLAVGFASQTYINGAFGTTWHLSGAFGFRRLIECTPIFVLGLALLLDWLQRRVGYWPLLLGALGLVYWNFGLMAQWAIVRPEMRTGLIWQDMLYYQFVETPRQVVGRFGDLLFDRCRIVRNQNC